MTAEQCVEYLMSRNRQFDRNVIRDTDRRGEDLCEMLIQNPSLPNCPITVSVRDSGCSLSVGRIENVTGDDRMTADQLLSAINDVMNDKILFLLAYKDGDGEELSAPYMTKVFAITGGEDDMSDEYEKFIAKISKPINKHLRPLTSLKGSFHIFNFSGTVNKTIVR